MFNLSTYAQDMNVLRATALVIGIELLRLRSTYEQWCIYSGINSTVCCN